MDARERAYRRVPRLMQATDRNMSQLRASLLSIPFDHLGQNHADNGMTLELVKYLYRRALECRFAQI